MPGRHITVKGIARQAAANSGQKPAWMEFAFRHCLGVIFQELSRGRRVSFQPVGCFGFKYIVPHQRYHLQKKCLISYPERNRIYFRPSKELDKRTKNVYVNWEGYKYKHGAKYAKPRREKRT